MPYSHARIHAFAIAIVSSIAVLSLATACSKPAGNPNSSSSAPTTQAGKAASNLGDLSEFRRIAADTSALVDKGDLATARTRIKDLEVAWDAAEAGLKPRTAQDWHTLDKAIDRALQALRAAPPVPAGCKAAVAALMASFGTLQATN